LLAGNLTAQSDRNNQFDFALIGDVPYSPTAGISPTKVQIYPSAEYNSMIADINNHNKVAFTMHMCDIKAGDSWCIGGNPLNADGTPKVQFAGANVYTSNLALFNTFTNAVVYLPGDNEWTDCHRTNNGAYNPQERLGYIRNVFFSTNQSLGQHSITLTRQTDYPENVTWRYGNIVFVTINQPGSNNNHQRNVTASSPAPTDFSETEYTARNTANIAWVNAAFDGASADPNTKAIVIMQQANPFERFLEAGQGYTESGYAGFVSTLRTRTLAFGKPVVFVGGDTHTVRIDKPLMTALTTSATAPAGGALVVSYPGIPGPPVGTVIAGTSVTAATMFLTTTGAICTTASATCIVPNRGTSLAPNPTVSSPNILFNITTGANCTTASGTCVAPTRVQNFTRVEVFGSPDVEWIRAVVDPFDPNVFSFATQTIAGTGHGRDGRTDDDDLQ